MLLFLVRRGLVTLLAALCLLSRPAWSVEDQGTTQRTAEKVVASITAAFRARDGHAFGAEFWPDAEFINVFGQIVSGREAIAGLHQRVFNGPLKDRVVEMQIRKVRLLAPTVMVIDTTDSDASGSSDQVTRLKLILEKRGNQWRVAYGHNTPITTPPFNTGVGN